MDEEAQTVYDDVCRVIGRAVVMLSENNMPLNREHICQMLRVHAEQDDDICLSDIYAVAKTVMA